MFFVSVLTSLQQQMKNLQKFANFLERETVLFCNKSIAKNEILFSNLKKEKNRALIKHYKSYVHMMYKLTNANKNDSLHNELKSFSQQQLNLGSNILHIFSVKPTFFSQIRLSSFCIPFLFQFVDDDEGMRSNYVKWHS